MPYDLQVYLPRPMSLRERFAIVSAALSAVDVLGWPTLRSLLRVLVFGRTGAL